MVKIFCKIFPFLPPQLTLTAWPRFEDGGQTRQRLSAPRLGFVPELVQDLLGHLVGLLLHHLLQDLQLPLLQQLQLLLVPDDLPVVPPGQQSPQAPDEPRKDEERQDEKQPVLVVPGGGEQFEVGEYGKEEVDDDAVGDKVANNLLLRYNCAGLNGEDREIKIFLGFSP